MLNKKLSLVTVMIASAVAGSAFAADNAKDSAFVADSSYAVGALMSKQMQQIIESQKDLVNYNKDEMLKGFTETFNGKGKFDDKQLGEQLTKLDNVLKEKTQAKIEADAKAAEEQGAKFRAEYAKKDGVKQTKSGLLYKIEKAGSGDAVSAEDTVKVHYKGTLINGEEFDSSYKRGEPVEFQLNKLVKGWVEGIPMIKKGGKIELVLPPELGYGAQATGSIPPNSTLVFEIELLDVKKAKK
ncbi:FKBP-type peptidyl-prolyl cis-trans isomerase [Pasteurellaceae bacterium TAE3-ERU1]|nr:FKBP-type peptidyl-prolyl cis-trans isomerase [Pasteurellaceae bacterium TAE3-ERU1]